MNRRQNTTRMADPEKQSEQSKTVQQKTVIGKYNFLIPPRTAEAASRERKKSRRRRSSPPPVMASTPLTALRAMWSARPKIAPERAPSSSWRCASRPTPTERTESVGRVFPRRRADSAGNVNFFARRSPERFSITPLAPSIFRRRSRRLLPRRNVIT